VKTAANRADKVLRNKALHASVFVVAMMSFALNGANAFATNFEPTDYRIASAGDKFEGTRLVAVAFKIRPPRRLREE